MIFKKLDYTLLFEITKVEITFNEQFAGDLVLSVPKNVPLSTIKSEFEGITDDIQSLKQLDIDSVIFGKSLVDQGDSIWIPLLMNPYFGCGNIGNSKVTIHFQGNLESEDQVAIFGNVYTSVLQKIVPITHNCSGIVTLQNKSNIKIINKTTTNLMYFYGTYIESKIKSIKLTHNDSQLFDLDPKALRINQFYRGHSTDAMIIYFSKEIGVEGLEPGTLQLDIEYQCEKEATINVTCYTV
jgi:hypothetical protein